MGGLMFGGYGSLLGVLFYGGTLVARGKLSVGALTSFAMYSATVGLGFSGISQVYSETSKALSSAQRVFEVLETNPSIDQEHGSYLAHVIGKLDLVEFFLATDAGRGLVNVSDEVRVSSRRLSLGARRTRRTPRSRDATRQVPTLLPFDAA